MAHTSDEIRVVRLRLICLSPPPEQHEHAITEFGLQDKRQVLHPGQAEAGDAVRFELDVEAKRSPAANGVRFGGPFVHGTSAAPFLYLGWRRKEGAPSGWIKR